MIKKLHEITLRDVILLDATKSAKVLKKYWFIPIWMCKKELEAVAKEIFESIGGQTVNELENKFDKLNSYRKLQILDALHKALTIEISLKSRVNAWKIILQKDYKESANLESIIQKVKEYSGIEINAPRELIVFEEYVKFRVDKYREMYPEKEVENSEETSISEVIYSVFNYMGEPHNRDMLLIDFITMKRMAESRIKQSKSIENGEQ